MADARIDELKELLPRCLLADWVRLGSRLVRLLRDRHHPARHEEILNRLLAQARASAELRELRRMNVPHVSYPRELPITSRKDEIVTAIRKHQVVVVAGETGSGKTTQLPKMLLEAGLGIEGKIGCTQPRRVAALSISRRIAEELGISWGREVGCKIRFDDRSSPETYIKLMTDGILLAETQGDPLLTEYNAIIIDEAHERSLNIDFLLGYLKGLLAKRQELKLIITSATIDTEAFSRAFNHAPIIEVSGRVYPVEVEYAPFDTASEESGEMTYIDAAVQATERSLCEPGDGDILIFMPGERDIRETSDLLEGRYDKMAEVIPLFGRLSAGEQERVFAPTPRRKVVVATNIAETSLTIPNIRFVIDSGLARMSRYNSRTRTRRLPVEAISQSSANQRKGRSGRVRNGVCIRLYSQADFNERPLYTQPEIQRANLAEVILRMKAYRLGEIETFPFINPPSPAAIDGGYKLLQELGALDQARELTPMGRDLARLPIDPSMGRMLLQSQKEHATRELLIISAGLSIQDPRERPFEQKDAAAAAHKRFEDPRSDFITLLNIWNAYHDDWEKLRTQSQRRKFCRAHFLSYLRMREWQDLHVQLHDALEEIGIVRLNESSAAYEAIHRSVLSGLLGHIACRTERNQYKAAANRQVMVFPGSALFDRDAPARKAPQKKDAAVPKAAKVAQPAWIVAGEIVETSQLFARTIAGIEPDWIVELASHLCKVTHSEPQWNATNGRVMVTEKVTLYGLEVRNRRIGYGGINPKEATEIFIRSALVEEALFPEPVARHSRNAPTRSHELIAEATQEQRRLPPQFRFLEQNRQLRNKLEIWRTRSRRHDLPDLDEALYVFYTRRIEDVSSLQELGRFLQSRDPNYLCATEADLTGEKEAAYTSVAFPDSVPLGGESAAVSYAYAPGEEQDGATIKLAWEAAQAVSPAGIAWAVPGFREEQIHELLRTLPKTIRRQLMPLAPKAAEIARELSPGPQTLLHDLAVFLRTRYGLEVSASSWPANALPAHLHPRVEIVGKNQKTLGAGRNLEQLRSELAKGDMPADSADWRRAAQHWEKFGLTSWSFGDFPGRITVREEPVPLYAWPRLHVEDGNVCVRLFRTEQDGSQAHSAGVHRLVELALQRDLGWLQKDLRALARYEPLLGGLCNGEELQAGAFENARGHLMPEEAARILTKAQFEAAAQQARERLPGLGQKLIDLVDAILKIRQEIVRALPAPPSRSAPGKRTLSDFKQLQTGPAKAPQTSCGMQTDLEALLSRNFLALIPFTQLQHIPRYLKAIQVRAERARLNPAKDQERARQLTPYLAALQQFRASSPAPPAARREIEVFRWMFEEYKVSLFAQELGTAVPVSPKRLEAQLEAIRRAISRGAV